MPYDLYGTYYKSRHEAEMAEIAQCNEIDLRYQQKEIEKMQQDQHNNEWSMWHHIQSLEHEIQKLKSIY